MSSSLNSLYQQLILDHYKAPSHKGFGSLEGPEVIEVHHVNPTCGDEITLRVRLDKSADDGARISEIAWEGQGCSISQASTSIMMDLVDGRPLGDALAMTEEFREFMTGRGTKTLDEDRFEDAIAFIGVPQYAARVKCALLGWMAMKDAVVQAAQAHPVNVIRTDETFVAVEKEQENS